MTSLSVLDLVPISSGCTAARGPAQHRRPGPAGRGVRLPPLLARRAPPHPGRGRHRPRRADRPGRRRPPSTIRVGSGAVQIGHQHRAVGGRAVRPARRAAPGPHRPRPRPFGPAPAELAELATRPRRRPSPRQVVDGLLIPRAVLLRRLARLAALRAAGRAAAAAGRRDAGLRRAGRRHPRAAGRDLPVADGLEAHAVPGEGADVERVGAGQQRRRERRRSPGERGLPFAANYHVSPATVLEAVDGLPGRVPPSAALAAPVRDASPPTSSWPRTTTTARELATRYGLWVRSIRTGAGAIPFPTPGGGRRPRVDRRGPGAGGGPAGHPVRRLARGRSPSGCAVLRDVTGADELLVTTITHDHADRVRSYELLAEEWRRS